jgi:transcriptional regulator with XRE-family HTH domain
MHDILAAIGEEVRRLRLRRKLSQDELAHKAGLHRAYVGAIERGEKNVTILTLQSVAKAMEVPIRDLFPRKT